MKGKVNQNRALFDKSEINAQLFEFVFLLFASILTPDFTVGQITVVNKQIV